MSPPPDPKALRTAVDAHIARLCRLAEENILLSSTTSRPELSPHLIHFSKAAGSLDAFSMLLKIIGEKGSAAAMGS